VVLVSIMIINPSSSTGSQCKNSISLVFVDISCWSYLLCTEIEAFGLLPDMHWWWWIN